jgi:hypothetical protein
MTASPAGADGPSRLAPPAPLPLPRRAPADPTDETERLRDWGLLTAVLDALTADELESCPGMLVAHADGRLECLEGDSCPPELVLHPGTATCSEVLGDCC